VCFLVALAASAALFAHYLSPTDSGFCGGANSGCEVLRKSDLNQHFGSVPLPLVGMIAFGVLFAISLWPRRSELEARRVALGLFTLTGLGALCAIGLVLYQVFYAHAYCWLCLIVDGAAILASSSTLALQLMARKGGLDRSPRADGIVPWSWAALAVLALIAPLAWSQARPSAPVPAEIKALYQAGKINVVEFADFECPYCRALHPLLKTVMESYPGQVNFVRLNMPLDMHPHAEEAARASVCAETLKPELAEEMADKLFTIQRLRKNSGLKIAEELGFDRAAFSSCLGAPETFARLERDRNIVRAAGFKGLPTTFVGSQRFVGVRNETAWRDAFDHAARSEGQWGIPTPLYLAIVAALTLTLFSLGLWRNQSAVRAYQKAAEVIAVTERGTLQNG
jgi:protein-disulfide isomerase/uncharacterized membrane protein